jgi:hypothetical protein
MSNSFRPGARFATVTVSLSTSTARTAAALDPGWYRVWCDQKVFIRQGGAAIEATAAAGTPIAAELPDYIFVSSMVGVDDWVAGILSTGTGTLYLTRQ